MAEIIFKTILDKGGRGEKGATGESYEVPTGSIICYNGADTPSGWEECETPDGFLGMAQAYGNVGVAGTPTSPSTEFEINQVTLNITTAVQLATDIAGYIGADIATLSQIGDYSSAYLLYMNPKDLETLTGVFVGGYVENEAYHTTVGVLCDGVVQWYNVWNGSLTSFEFTYYVGDNGWIIGRKDGTDIRYTLKLAYSQGHYIDDEDEIVGVYGMTVGTYCIIYAGGYSQSTQYDLVTIQNGKLSLAPIGVESGRIISDDLFIVTSFATIDETNGSQHKLEGDTFTFCSTAYPAKQRLAVRTAEGE